ncbi:hypothetical protein BDV24DRAFT_145326 [Aspergillus arachidicola]|uniref:Uncharacterized protein n=1 Tax=Aspergillus arachidicola TaxID=656916 RepID=A0A5N6XP68_9EURO|nr:hypothetical protein BDV24DRAFT_145326 [Aspergillus arachidicola]
MAESSGASLAAADSPPDPSSVSGATLAPSDDPPASSLPVSVGSPLLEPMRCAADPAALPASGSCR